MRPDPRTAARSVNFGLQKRHHIDHAIIITGVRNAVGPVVVVTVPDRVGSNAIGNHIERTDQQLTHA